MASLRSGSRLVNTATLTREATYDQAFARATERCPPTVMNVTIGKVTITISVAGPELAERLTGPFSHLQSAGDRPPMIRLKAWSQSETGVAQPPDPADDEFYRTGGHCAGVAPDGSGATLWFANAETMTRGDIARPFQRVLIPMLYRHGLASVHAALVGEPGEAHPAGLMLAGPSGSGKSTTTLGLIERGYEVVADDCFAVEFHADDTITGHSMFGSACLTEDGERRVPDLPGRLLHPPGGKRQSKSVLLFPPGRDSPMVRSLPIRALIFPDLADHKSTRLVPMDKAEATRRFMPGLRFLIRFDALGRSDLFASLTRMVDLLPAYRLELGPHLSDTWPLLQALSQELSA